MPVAQLRRQCNGKLRNLIISELKNPEPCEERLRFLQHDLHLHLRGSERWTFDAETKFSMKTVEDCDLLLHHYFRAFGKGVDLVQWRTKAQGLMDSFAPSELTLIAYLKYGDSISWICENMCCHQHGEDGTLVRTPLEPIGRVEGSKTACVDHNDVTGMIRGFLCMQCNTCLGQANEEVSRIMGLGIYANQRGTRSQNPLQPGVLGVALPGKAKGRVRGQKPSTRKKKEELKRKLEDNKERKEGPKKFKK